MSAEQVRLADEGSRALPRRLKLTQAMVVGLKPPAGKAAAWVYDDKVQRLAVRVTAKGQVFYWYGRPKGEPRPVRYHIGSAKDIHLNEARERAQAISSRATAGENPHKVHRAEVEQARRSVSLSQLWERYRNEHVKPNCSAHSLKTDQSRYDLHLSRWAARRVDQVTREDVEALHGDLAKSTRTVKDAHGKTKTTPTPNVADKAVKLLRRIFTWAKIEPNPARGVKMLGDDHRQRYMSVDEVRKLFAALDACESLTVADVIRFAIFTGARKGNVCAARWQDVNLPAGLWVIPKDQSKNGQPMAVNLLPEAVALLEQRRSLVPDDCPWIFPGRRRGQPITSPHKIWGNIRKAAGLTDVRFHDFRHTLASHMAMSGATLLQIGQQLGHASRQSTARYAHLEAAAARPATAAALKAMLPKPEK